MSTKHHALSPVQRSLMNVAAAELNLLVDQAQERYDAAMRMVLAETDAKFPEGAFIKFDAENGSFCWDVEDKVVSSDADEKVVEPEAVLSG